MELIKIKIKDIKPYEKNARKNDNADEHYCDVIIDRWEKFTGLKAEKNIKEV